MPGYFKSKSPFIIINNCLNNFRRSWRPSRRNWQPRRRRSVPCSTLSRALNCTGQVAEERRRQDEARAALEQQRRLVEQERARQQQLYREQQERERQQQLYREQMQVQSTVR